jgi:hypothetical protein
MITSKFDPIGRDLALVFDDALGPRARSRILAEFAQTTFQEADDRNTRALGRRARSRRFVDGREGAPISGVRPDGVVVFEWDLAREAAIWIGEQLVIHSPFRTGTYERSHRMFIDGREVSPGTSIFGGVGEIVFLPLADYARPIERGESSQAPEGVYQVVAALARRRFGAIVQIAFAWRRVAGLDYAQPAIVITGL